MFAGIAMTGVKFTYIVAFTTATTLLLQIMLLYKNQCYFSRNSNSPEKIMFRPKSQSFTESQHPILSVTRQSVVEFENHGLQAMSPRPKNKRRLTIGIPTIKRRDGNYFLDMLSSMFNKTSEKDLKEIVFVIFLADLNNTAWKTETEVNIESKYSKYVESGSLKVIQAPKEFYEGMVRYGNDSYKNWRTKQNYDYAFLMKYCEHFSEFYMQMEDDVKASDGYYAAITEFVGDQTDDKWICLEFSELGFIGKLYHSKHIRNLADMLIMFSHSQPVDYTYLYFNMLMENGWKKIRKPTLFQHMGFHSSLAEKIQPLRDRYFDFPAKEWKGDNPPAKMFTTFKENQDFPPNLPYLHEPGHFWSYSSAKENDTFLIVFDSSHSLDKVIVETGSIEHPGDIVHNGVLEVSATVSGTAENPTCEDFIVLDKFQEGKLIVTTPTIKSKLGLVKSRCLRIRITKPQIEWVVIKEIAVFLSSA